MHEYSLVADLVRQVERIAREHGVTPAGGAPGRKTGGQVLRLHVAVGELSGVEIPLLQTAYDTFRARTICCDAELRIRRVATAWACPACGEAVAPDAVLRCRDCGLPARLRAGDEILLERIEMDVPEHETDLPQGEQEQEAA